MPYYEGDVFDDYPSRGASEQPPAPIRLVETSRTHTFEEDLEDFKRGADLILQHAGLLDEAPEDTIKISNHSSFPLEKTGLDRITISQLGYPIYLLDKATMPDGRPLPAHFVECVPADPKIRQTIPQLSASHAWDIVRNGNADITAHSAEDWAVKYEEALHIFLGAISYRGTYKDAFQPEYYRHSKSLRDYTASAFRIIEAEQPTLLERGHMTNLLVSYASFGDEYRQRFKEQAARYQQLLDKGARPLGYEELLGLSMRHIRFHIKTDPTYPKPPNSENGDY